MLINADQVASWLRNNPSFFEQYSTVLTELHIPHPHGGRAISIGERQVLSLRQKNRALENKLGELIQIGRDNDQIGEKIHRLALELIAAASLDATLDAIYASLEGPFQVPHAAIRVWNQARDDDGRAELSPVLEELKQFVAPMSAPQCGQHAVYEVNRWFGEAAPRLRSFALVPLKADQTAFGLLALASEDAQRFYPEMGTLYLSRLGELVSAGVVRHLQGQA